MKLANKLIIIYRESIKRAFVTLMLILISVITFYMYMTDRIITISDGKIVGDN